MDDAAARRSGRLRFALALLIAVLFVLPSRAPLACDVDRRLEAMQFVENLTRKAGDILTQNPNPLIPPLVPMTAHILENVKFDPLAKYAMGRFWHQATPEQRLEYKSLFRETVSYALAQQVMRFRNATLEISKRPVFGANALLLKSKLTLPRTAATHLGWRIAFNQCRAFLVDILRDNVSLITVKREEFRAVVSRSGVGGLLIGLRRVATRQAQTAVGGQGHTSRAILSRLLLEAAAAMSKRVR